MTASILTTREWKRARELGIQQFMPRELRPHRNIAAGKRLMLARIAFGVERQGKFAEAAGMRSNTYNMLETGENFPGLDSAMRLCERYPGLTLDWIYRGKMEGMPSWLSNAIASLVRAEAERPEVVLQPAAQPLEAKVVDLPRKRRRKAKRQSPEAVKQ